MKPLNAQERTFGLLKFAGLFTFTLTLVLFAVYFDVSAVPKAEVDGYKSQVNDLQETVQSDNKLISQIADLNNNLIQYQSNPSNAIAASAVGNGITALADMAKKDSVSFCGKLSGQVITGYGIAVSSINKTVGSGNASDDLKKMKDDLKACQDDAKDKNQQILTLQNTLALYQNKK
jgi:uncharacterized protein YlxW (UPF0749 family)